MASDTGGTEQKPIQADHSLTDEQRPYSHSLKSKNYTGTENQEQIILGSQPQAIVSDSVKRLESALTKALKKYIIL